MAESIVLDPTAVSGGRTQLDITSWVRADGVDWGDAVFEAYMAQGERGSIPVDGRLPNRVVTLPLTLRAVGGTSFATIRSNLQQKVGLFQREGGWLMRQVGATPLYADVVNATLHLGGSWLQAIRDADIEASLVLECVPDWYGAEVDAGDNVETTLPELIFTETGITGNYPARVRVVVDEDDAETQLGLIWGFQCRNYSSASTAALAYAGTALQALDAATSVGGAITHTNLGVAWTPVLGTNIAGTAFLTHTGSYRTWAAIASTANGDDVSCRFVWDVGDLTSPVENAPVMIPNTAGTFVMNLGEVRLDASPVGTHRWQGMVQAKGITGGEDVTVSRLWFQPLDESAGYLRAPLTTTAGLAAYSARDEFNQVAGALTGKTLPVGGAWTWIGSGDTDDFNVDDTTHTVTRGAVSDTATSFLTGRVVYAATPTLAAVATRIDFKVAKATSAATQAGLIARYVDTSNLLVAKASLFGTGSNIDLSVEKRVAGTTTALGTVFDVAPEMADTWYTMQLSAYTSGLWTLEFGPKGGVLELIATGTDTTLATGGALDDGKVGFFDWHSNAGARTRTYDNFAAWVPVRDAVMHSSQSLELRTEGMFREDSTGTAYGRVPHVVGDLPRLPPAGLEARTCRVFLKASRGDLDTLPDTGVDDISARVYYRPSYLYVAGT